MQNHSNENECDLHENENTVEIHFHMNRFKEKSKAYTASSYDVLEST